MASSSISPVARGSSFRAPASLNRDDVQTSLEALDVQKNRLSPVTR